MLLLLDDAGEVVGSWKGLRSSVTRVGARLVNRVQGSYILQNTWTACPRQVRTLQGRACGSGHVLAAEETGNA